MSKDQDKRAERLSKLRKKARDSGGAAVGEMVDETMDLPKQACALDKKTAESQADLDEVQTELDQLGPEKTELEHQLSRLEATLAPLKKARVAEEKQIKKEVAKRSDSEVADAVDAKLAEKREELKALKDEVKNLPERIQLLRASNSELHQQVEELRS